MTEKDKSSDDVGCLGCMGMIIAAWILWGLLFGVNYHGKHYGVSCAPNGLDVQSVSLDGGE